MRSERAQMAVVDHRDAVGDFEQFVEVLADDHDRAALRARSTRA